MEKNIKDVFFESIAKKVGVPSEKIQLKLSKKPGQITCIGPIPTTPIMHIPKVTNYCFIIVLETKPPASLCDAYRQEYQDLKDELAQLIIEEAWDEAGIIIDRLRELKNAIDNICRFKRHVITYCVFPDDTIDDPYPDRHKLPPKPSIPPLDPQNDHGGSS